MSDVFTLTEQIADMDDQIAEVEAMQRVCEWTGGNPGVFIDRLGELYAERRQLVARRLDDEIEAFEKGAIALAMTGRWTAEHDARLGTLYDERRRLHDAKGQGHE